MVQHRGHRWLLVSLAAEPTVDTEVIRKEASHSSNQVQCNRSVGLVDATTPVTAVTAVTAVR